MAKRGRQMSNLKGSLAEIEGLEAYFPPFHHDGESGHEAAQLVEAELRLMANKALSLIYRDLPATGQP